MKFYYESKDKYFVSETPIDMCCKDFFEVWTSQILNFEVYKNGIRFYEPGVNPNTVKIHKQCPFCGEPIKTEKVKDTGLKFIEVYPF